MSATSAVLRAEITIPGRPGAEFTAQPGGIPNAANPLRFFAWFAALIGGLVSGLGARVRLAVEDSTPTAATGSVAFATALAGDVVIISGPLGTARYVAVAGAADASLGQFSIDTSDDATGASFVLALAAFPKGRPLAVGVNSSGTVALTAVLPGAQGNAMVVSDVEAGTAITCVTFSGGRDAGSLQKVIGTFTNAPADGGTLTIGNVVLTTAASPANEDEWDNGTNAATAAANLTACINTNSKLKGLVLATNPSSGVVHIQLLQTGRIGTLITCVDALSNYTQDRSTGFTPAQTSTWIASPAVFAVGASTTAQA